MHSVAVFLMPPRSASGPDRSLELRRLAVCATKRVSSFRASSSSANELSPSGVRLTLCELTVLLMPPRSVPGLDRSVGLRRLAVCATKRARIAPTNHRSVCCCCCYCSSKSGPSVRTGCGSCSSSCFTGKGLVYNLTFTVFKKNMFPFYGSRSRSLKRPTAQTLVR